MSKFPIKKEIESDLRIGREYIFVYAKCIIIDIKSLRNKYIQLIGGQTHVQCNLHKKTLGDFVPKK